MMHCVCSPMYCTLKVFQFLCHLNWIVTDDKMLKITELFANTSMKKLLMIIVKRYFHHAVFHSVGVVQLKVLYNKVTRKSIKSGKSNSNK